MGARSTAREAALQMLYALEAGEGPAERVIREYWREMPGDAKDRLYADAIVAGVARHLERLDERIGSASENWRLERMTRVDRNVLRLATWEILEQPDVPRAVLIDEAVEIAKRFGTAESGAFVNGVLTRVADDAGRRDLDR